MPTKRKPYRIKLRRMVTGCDYTTTLWLKSEADAFARASLRVPARERNWLRLVDCSELDAQEAHEAREALRVHAGLNLP